MAARAASIASRVPASAKTSPSRSRSVAAGTRTPPSRRVTASTEAPVRPRRFSSESVLPTAALPGSMHRGQCYTGPSIRNRVTRPADGAGDVLGRRRALVLEQLARGRPQGATQTFDRIGPDEAEPSARPGQAVDGVEAEAGELGQAVGGQAARLQQLPQPQAEQASTAIADFLAPVLCHIASLRCIPCTGITVAT